MKEILSVTDAARAHAARLAEKAGKPVKGLRVSVKPQGCSGMKYDIQYAEEETPGDEVVPLEGGLNIYVDPMAVMFVVGTEMDYQDGKFESGFQFNNPNETGRCGCGESFMVEKEDV